LFISFACAKTETDCAPANGITPICGFLAPEDLEVVPGGRALIVGGFSLDNENGDIRALNLQDGSIQKIYPPDPAALRPEQVEPWGDPNCPGPPEGFAAHGIHLSARAGGGYTLLVVNHTGREAVEWLEITETEGKFAAAWRGCVVVDEELWINDVAMLPDGGLVASHMMPREIAGTLFDRPQNDKVETGYVVEWQKDGGWKKVPGTEGALPNGIQVSADGSVIYSNHYQSEQTVAVHRTTGERLWATAVKGAPDNMSITPDGKLLIATHLMSLREIRGCMTEPGDFCGLPFALHSIDPASGEATQLFESSGPPFGGTTVAVQSGEHIYMGAFDGSRIGRIPIPQ
jgi:hypothetical protein